MTSSIGRNTLYNLIGMGLPVFVGVFTIPRLIQTMGMERFGVLTLGWALLGYFSLFDMGLGRALTQVIAEKMGCGERKALPDIIHTALRGMFVLGCIGGACLAILTPLLIGSVLKIPHTLQGETRTSLFLMSVCIPAVTLTTGLRGILEANGRFLATSLLRLGLGVMTFLCPWLVTFWTPNLAWVISSLLLMRCLSGAAHFWVGTKLVEEFKAPGRFQRDHLRSLLQFGGWMTVTNIISPLMVNIDRFFIATFVSIGAVAYYTTPFDAVTKLLAVSAAISTVIFPLFGYLYKTSPGEIRKLYSKSIWMILAILGPVMIVMILVTPFLLRVWLGSDFSIRATPVMRFLCAGVLVNAVAGVPFACLQGMGRSDLTAKFHLVEVPIYFLTLWYLATRLGINGVAFAWLIRVSLDLVLLHVFSAKLFAAYSAADAKL